MTPRLFERFRRRLRRHVTLITEERGVARVRPDGWCEMRWELAGGYFRLHPGGAMTLPDGGVIYFASWGIPLPLAVCGWLRGAGTTTSVETARG